MMLSAWYSARATSRALAPMRARNLSSASSRSNASAIRVASAGGTSNPVPSRTASTLPPTFVATTGRAAAMASTMEFGNPSLNEVSVEMSNR